MTSYSAYFQACEESGRRGEEYLFSELEARLLGTGLEIRSKSEENKNAPFDIEVVDGSRVIAAIENKDLGPTTKGTWIKGPRKKKKLAYAERNGIPLVFTTVTRRDAGLIGFREGIINGSSSIFDYDVGHLISRISEAREG